MKKINFLIYKNLIESDLLLLNNKLFKKQNRINNIIKKQNFLDVFVLNKELNQFIYLIKNLKKKRGIIKVLDNNLEKNFSIFNQINKKEVLIKPVEAFLTKSTFNNPIKKYIKESKLLLNISTEKMSSTLFYSFFKYSYFLIQLVNLYNFFNNCGFYKIFNDIENYKNIIFITLLIKKI